MTFIQKYVLIIGLMVCCTVAMAHSAEGLWTIKDEKTGEKRAIVRLVATQNQLTGTIIRIFPKPGETRYCRKCPNPFKNKSIIGLQFLWGLEQEGKNVWSNGHIINPKSGKIYHSKITVKEDKLYVRGYIGLAMMGKTQIWVREEN